MQEIFIQNNINLKDMKKFIVLITVLVISCGFVDAGQRIQLNQLIGTWELLDDRYKDTSEKWIISDKMITTIRNYKIINETLKFEKKFYLSTGIPLRYDSTLVGKVKSGTHIIYYAKMLKIIRSYEIVSLKNDILTLKYYHEKSIGRDEGYDFKVFKHISR